MPTTEDLKPPPPDDEEGGALADKIEDRRKRVLALHLRKLTPSAIAAVVQVDRTTVWRDLAWIQEHWRERYGKASNLDPALVVGEALETYANIEREALLANARAIAMVNATDDELVEDERGVQTGPALSETERLHRRHARASKIRLLAMRQQQVALRTAMMARRQQMALLQDLGLVDGNFGKLSTLLELPRAEDIREALEAARALHPMSVSLMSVAERRWRKIPHNAPDGTAASSERTG